MGKRLVVCLALLGVSLRADFSYEQSTKITGGAMAGMMKMAGALSKQARMPANSQIMVKGDRMAQLHGDTGQIIDLSAGTITEINFAKKTYSVLTFEQMRDALKKMAEQMHQDQQADMNFKIDVKDTGASKEIQGLSTHEVILTLSAMVTDQKTGRQGELKMVSDMWIAKDVKGYDEVRAFHRRMAEKMAMMPGDLGAGTMPGMAQGMSELQKQAAKLDGVPMMQIVRVGDVPGGSGDAQQTGSSAPPPQAAPAPSAGDAAASAIAGRLGKLGGLGGFGRKKKPQEQPPAEPPAAQSQPAGAPAGPGSLMEMTTELTAFSSASVDGSKLQVPSGFQQVESPMLKMGGDK